MRHHSRTPLAATGLLGALALLLAACSGDPPTAGDHSTHPASITVTPDGGYAASIATNIVARTWPTIPLRKTFPIPAAARVGGASVSASVSASASASAANVNSPFDLSRHPGPLVTHATNWNLYVNCNGSSVSCWGSNSVSPSDFLKDLNRSRFIGILDQYLGTRAYGQFAFDSLGIIDGAIPANNNLATQGEIFNILFFAISTTGRSGLYNMYHVFLPQGTDMCDFSGFCYSPDVPNTFFFCAFHGAVLFNGTDTVVYSVEPYQNVDGCRNPNGSPHGVIDATASTLSHEFFEAATDPLLSTWYNVLTGQEIGDLCFVFEYNEFIGTRRYQIQSEYSNAIHNCSDAAP